MIPSAFLERLSKIIDRPDFEDIRRTFTMPDIISVRINPLKGNRAEILDHLRLDGLDVQGVPWFIDGYVVRGLLPAQMSDHPLVAQGKIYQQNLSSMIPAVILDPQPGERLLDACAAPGSKTTQMAAMIGAQGSIVAVESSRSRFFRLRAVCELLGATNVETKLCDLRRYRPAEGDLFDRILVDAPCSSEGRFKDDLSKTTDYWSVRKIKEMSYKQKGILMSAARLLKPGGALVYATCTFAPEENEEVVDWFLERSQGAFALEKISLPGVPAMPCLPEWQRHTYSAAIDQCLRVRPDGIYSGFFVAKFRKG